jgi:hypothetical protein
MNYNIESFKLSFNIRMGVKGRSGHMHLKTHLNKSSD